MAERDPFGRLPDENPLAGLGSLSDANDRQDGAEPVVSARPADSEREERPRTRAKPDPPQKSAKPRAKAAAATPPQKASTPDSRQQQQLRELLGAVEQMKRGKSAMPGLTVLRSIGRVIRVVRIVVFVAIVAVIGSVALGAFSSGSIKERIDDLSDVELPNFESPNSESLVTPAEPEPAGLSGASLLAQRNLAPALRRLRTSGLGRLKSLSIRPERIDAQLLTKAGRLRSVQYGYDGKLRTLNLSGAGFGGSPTIPFRRANSAAPQRLVRSAAGRLEKPATQVGYVVLVNAGAPAVWTVVMQGGEQFLGDARGRITRRLG
jgi:hypothetical protein